MGLQGSSESSGAHVSDRGALLECPNDDTLLAFVGGSLRDEEARAIEAHVSGCDVCAEVLAEAGRELVGSDMQASALATTPSRPMRPPELGARLGRYLLVDVLGRGAMGVVFTAYDPELDRRVALKLLRVTRHLGATAGELEARIVAEAQAMARLSHPNVVSVFDIGTSDHGIYIAMELVRGVTLRRWLEGDGGDGGDRGEDGAAKNRRPWRAVLDAFIDAGEGLASAHEAGIVHRDFKPDNVLVEVSGGGAPARVMVTDFGLSRLSGPAELPDEISGSGVRSSGPVHRTVAGAVLGTPAYMSPEQLAGRPADERADVFAFGVALFEGIFGIRPFEGGSIEALRAALARGEPRPFPPSRAPRWLRRVLLELIATDRERRTPTMRAALARLRADPARRLKRYAVPIGLGLGVAGASLAAWWFAGAPLRACREGAERAAAIWSAPVRDAMSAAFAAVPAPFAGDAFRRVAAGLDGWVDAWRDERVEACEATHGRGEQSAELLDLRLRCLDERAGELSSLVGSFAIPDTDLVQGAADAVDKLPAPAICGEVERLRARVPPPTDPAKEALVATAEATRASSQAALLAGRFANAVTLADAALRQAEATNYAPEIAAALVNRGRAAFAAGQETEARGYFDRALRASLAAGDDRLFAEAAQGNARSAVRITAEPAEVDRWFELALGAIERLGGDPERHAEVLVARGELYVNNQLLDKGLALFVEARAMLEAAGVEGTILGTVLDDEANALQQLGRVEEALAVYRRAVAYSTERQGALHPYTVGIRSNYANGLTVAGRFREAAAELDEIAALAARVYPPDHVNIAIIGHMRGLALGRAGRSAEGLAAHRDALALEERLYPGEPSAYVYSLLAMAETELEVEDTVAARAHLERFLAAVRAAKGESHGLIAEGLTSLAAVELVDGDLGRVVTLLDEASAAAKQAAEADQDRVDQMQDVRANWALRGGHVDEALSLSRELATRTERAQGPDAIALVSVLLTRGKAELAAGLDADAQATTERALGLASRYGYDGLGKVELYVMLAKALRVRDPARSAAQVREVERALAGQDFPRARRLSAELDALR